MFFSASILDDLLGWAFPALLTSPVLTSPMRKKAREITGVQLELTNPRARLSRTETRGRPFSCLGELLWYLAGSDSLDFIRYYIPKYRDESEDGLTIYGAYGPRLFSDRGINQIASVTRVLKERKDTRRAVIQLFDREDIEIDRKQVPCTCTLQFLLRAGKLHLVTMMRSNDAFIGLSHDIFCFTMIQEIVARSLDAELGLYRHFVGSLHLYDRDREAAEQYLSEGVQSSVPMPEMPRGDPWPSIGVLLAAEKSIREAQQWSAPEGRFDPYWADLTRLLQAFARTGYAKEIDLLKGSMAFRGYDPYLRYRAHMPPRRRPSESQSNPSSGS